MLEVTQQHHWDTGLTADPFGHTAQEQSSEPFSSVRAHDDQVTTGLLASLENAIADAEVTTFGEPRFEGHTERFGAIT